MQQLKQKTLEFVKENGPVLPVQVSKAINENIIFAGAFLSELLASQMIKITSAKVGASPLYYVEGQEERLEVLRNHLSERPGLAFDFLKDKMILRDKHCEPWQRVALREIKDFAIPLNVNIKGNVELFWKWYLVSDEAAKEIILPMIEAELNGPVREVEEVPIVEEVVAEVVEEVIAEEVPVIEEVIPEVVEEPVEEVQESLDVSFKLLENGGEFYDNVIKYFTEKNVSIVKQNIVTKNRELNFIIHIPTSLGNLKYYVIARNKKKLNDADLSLAYHQGSDYKLPVIVIGTGEITKKAQKYIEENIKGLLFKKLK
jgi:hypothetical protein